ncbi:helix-turn-helix domain-containing protein [Tumebacillus flagellatus]|uniref:HTH cro/C1-type domain-containing protein n=1 Tax=Tumebacillus flagellatus TaxID=1157490 RepID=A0A074M6P1_9BACL|nr:helix-turn-helix transcriptional regulator [Tumebacillus flagellatus]KEO81642.1 hypothetical protein EL26_19410 [Tumebacillus flagellatus]
MALDRAETTGERLRRLREESSLSLEQLAEGLLTPEMLLLIENNMGMPSKRVLTPLATRLGVTVDYFNETANKMRKRRVWEQIGNPLTIEGETALLFQHVYFPQQWLFNGNIVLADRMSAAIEKLTDHAKLLRAIGKDSYWITMYWKSIEKPHVPSLRVKGSRDKIYKHRLEVNLWKWNDFVCEALTYEDWYKSVMREVVAKLRSLA